MEQRWIDTAQTQRCWLRFLVAHIPLFAIGVMEISLCDLTGRKCLDTLELQIRCLYMISGFT
jgi:hypothetical protein